MADDAGSSARAHVQGREIDVAADDAVLHVDDDDAAIHGEGKPVIIKYIAF